MKRGFPDKVKHSSAYGAVHHEIITYGGDSPVKQSEEEQPSFALVLNSTALGSFRADAPDFIFLNESAPALSLENNRQRRSRTSAAMVGLALSLGSSDVLSLWHTKATFAAETAPTLEPLQDWASPSGTEESVATIVPPALPVEEVPFSLDNPASTNSSSPAFDLAEYYPHELYNHRVAEAETLGMIAEYYGIDPEILASLNHLTLESLLQVGQVLQFPKVFITINIDSAPQTMARETEVKPSVKSGLIALTPSADVKGGAKAGNTEQATPSIPLKISPLEIKTIESEAASLPIAYLPNSQTAETADVGLADLIPYRVQSGDTLDKIARTYHVSRSTLVAVNNIENPNLLKVDQMIGIPRPDSGLDLAFVPEVANQTEVEVPVLQTIQPKPEAQSAIQSNEVESPVSPDLLSVLRQDPSRFPYEPTNTLSGELRYQVRPGDTLSKIARTYGLPLSDLIQANRIANPNVIRVRQNLVIPSKGNGILAFNAEQPVQVASNPVAPALDLGQPGEPQTVRDEVAVQGTLQVNTAVIPTVPSLESIVQEPISLPRPALSVAPVDAPQVAVAPQTVTTPFNPSEGVVIPEAEAPASVESSTGKDYVSRLLAEIKVLQDQYRAGTLDSTLENKATENGTTAIPIAVAPAPQAAPPVVTAPSAVPQVSTLNRSGISALSSNDRINPEFNAPRREVVEVQPQAASPQLLAAASVSSSSYEPLVQSLVGQTVSPALLSLSADPYLPKDRTAAGYIWPAQGVLTSGYGWRWGRMHKGIDIAAPIGTPIVAAAPGVVITAGWNSGGYGYLVEVQHDDGSITLYAHNDRILVREGQYVEQGQQLSEMGSTGYSTGPHLHFEIYPSGDGAVNPMAYLPQ